MLISYFCGSYYNMVKIGNLELGEFPLLLAPMEDVSDPPFRALCKEQACDMMYTEFVSVQGLIRDVEKSLKKIELVDEERPVGIQIFGGELESMVEAVEVVERFQPDVLDINFGCPVKKVVGKGCGAALLQDIPKMVAMTEAVVKATDIPVTVKTRLGWTEETKYIVEVAERLQDVGIQAISIHGRTRKQMYKGVADWTLIGEVKNNARMHIPVFGNGDIDSPEKAKEYRGRYGVDGMMIGRAAIGYPWIFKEIKHYLKTGEMLTAPDISERVRVAKEHLRLSMEWKGERVGILEMRKHYTRYFRGYHGIKPFRMALVTEDVPEKLYQIMNEIEERYK
jgi:tRNA-dihydrouridine synthase B